MGFVTQNANSQDHIHPSKWWLNIIGSFLLSDNTFLGNLGATVMYVHLIFNGLPYNAVHLVDTKVALKFKI